MSDRAEPSAEETARMDREELDRVARAEAERAAHEARGKTVEHTGLAEWLRRLRRGTRPPE